MARNSPVVLLALHAALRTAGSALPACQAGERCEDTASGAGDGAYYWPMQKGNIFRTGASPFSVPKNLSAGPTWRWSDPHNDVIRATPLIDDKRNIYLSTIGGRIYKFSQNGELLWSRDTKMGLPSVAALYGGNLYSNARTGHVFAVDMETGKEVWKVWVSEHIAGDAGSLFVLNGTVIVATHNQFDADSGNALVHGMSAEDGSLKWTWKSEIPVYNFQASGPGDGTVVFQDRSGGLFRLGLDNGKLIWKSGKLDAKSRHTFTTGAAVIHEGRVFVVSNAGSHMESSSTGLLHTYRLEDGALLWEQMLAYPANQAVAVGKTGDRVSAVIGIGANPEWPVLLKLHAAGFPESIALAAGWLSIRFPRWFASPKSAAMVAFDAETGARQWTFDLEPYQRPATAGDSERLRARHDGISNLTNPFNDIMCLPDSCSQPVIGPDGTAYQGWQDGKIYAVKDEDGDGKIDPETEVSTYDLGEGFQGSLALAPGMLAAAPCASGLYVWRS